MTRRLKAGQTRDRADEPGSSLQAPELFVIDQSVHAAPSGLRTSPDQDLESPEEPEIGTGRERSRLAWLFGIAALVLGATFVLEGTPPEDDLAGPRQSAGCSRTGHRRGRLDARRAHLSRRARHGAGVEHRRHPQPGRRQACKA